jgi:hypothetical protein
MVWIFSVCASVFSGITIGIAINITQTNITTRHIIVSFNSLLSIQENPNTIAIIKINSAINPIALNIQMPSFHLEQKDEWK